MNSDHSSPELDHAADMLSQELAECHACIMAVFDHAITHKDPAVQLQSMLAATRLMQASAAAASALKRLRNPGTHHTVTVRPGEGESGSGSGGRGPTPEKLKTNGAA